MNKNKLSIISYSIIVGFLAVGIIIGLLFDNSITGVCIGLCVGVIISSIVNKKLKPNNSDELNTQQENEDTILEDENKTKRKRVKPDADTTYMTEGMCLGMCFGLMVGQTLFNNSATGLSLGMCIGLAIGSGIKKKK